LDTDVQFPRVRTRDPHQKLRSQVGCVLKVERRIEQSICD